MKTISDFRKQLAQDELKFKEQLLILSLKEMVLKDSLADTKRQFNK